MLGMSGILKPGLKFEDMIRQLAESGMRVPALGRGKEWIRERMELHRNPGKPFELQFSDGRWLRVLENKTREGGIVAILSDITENKLAEEALRESEERFRAVVDNLPMAVIIKDLDLRILMANKKYCEWLSSGHDQIVGKSVRDFFSEDDSDKVAALDRKVLDTGAVTEKEWRWAYPDGVTRDVFSQKFPIPGADGKTIAIGTVIADITGRKRAEEALRETKAHLDSAIESFSDGFILFDADDRCVFANDAYVSSHPTIRESPLHGMKIEEIVRKLVVTGFYGNASKEIEKSVQTRLGY